MGSVDLDDDKSAADRATDRVAAEVADAMQARPWTCSLMRAGWVAKSVVYGAIAYAVFRIGLDATEPEADAEYTGVVAILVDRPVTRVLLGVIAIGLILYVGFRMASVLLIDDDDADAWAHRIAYSFSALTYVFVAWVSATAALRGVNQENGSTVQRLSLRLLESGAGRLVLGIAAAGSLAIASYFAYKAVTRRFVREVDLDQVSDGQSTAITWTGVVGWLGRALLVASVGVFVLRAAIQADPSDAEGLDSAMHRLAAEQPTKTLVLVIGLSLAVYAAYCLLSAPYRRLAWGDNDDPDTDSTGRPT